MNPGTDSRCPIIDCPDTTTVCAVYPADSTTNQCAQFGVCRSASGACQPRLAAPNTPCEEVAPGALGRCDGAGNCVDPRVALGTPCSASNQCASGSCELASSGAGSVCCAQECVGEERCSVDFSACQSVDRRVTHVDAGSSVSCAVFDSGNVRCWGINFNSMLGTATSDNIGDDEPVTAAPNVDLGGQATQVAVGASHVCAVLAAGNVRCWGTGSLGALGYGNTITIGDDDVPADAGDVMVGASVLQLSVGQGFTCALLADSGRVRCWGNGGRGKLGYGNTLSVGDNQVPAVAGDVDVGGRVIQIASGEAHTCALLQGGTVRCWGFNSSGQLGYGSREDVGDDEVPASVGDVDVGGTVVSVGAGGNHTCVVLSTGAVRCWGEAAQGQLGYGNTNPIGDDETPNVAGDIDLGGSVSQLAVGSNHNCALLRNGTVRCWGSGLSGRLGYGNTQTIGDDEVPGSVGAVDMGGTPTLLTAGSAHTCALFSSGNVRCWGLGTVGQLGYGNTSNLGGTSSSIPSNLPFLAF